MDTKRRNWLYDRLCDLWDELERNGCVVARVPASTVTERQAQALLEREGRRLRLLSEVHAPGPTPLVSGHGDVDWREWLDAEEEVAEA